MVLGEGVVVGGPAHRPRRPILVRHVRNALEGVLMVMFLLMTQKTLMIVLCLSGALAGSHIAMKRSTVMATTIHGPVY